MATKDISVVSAGMVSIVVPCCGMLEYTKLCVPNLLKHSRQPFELVFLDIGSLDGTAEYLAGLQAGLAGQIRVSVVRTPTDLGLKEACRQALKETIGQYVVLLNNDCVVTNGWLNQLVGLASFSMANGLAGPMSNMAAPPQLVETVPYRTFMSSAKTPANVAGVLVDVAAIERFAGSYRKENEGKWVHAERLGFAALLGELKEVNERLWDIENRIRECEKAQEFGSDFIALARAVYQTNDRRAVIKRQLNEILGAKFCEEKEYHGG